MNPEFEKSGYALVKGFLPREVADLANDYVRMRIGLGLGKLPLGELGARGEYGDHFMETILQRVCPTMEEITGTSLWPTYAYYRLYRTGMELKKHIDRPACEYSVSVCLGRTHEDDWPLFVNGKALSCYPGDGVVYKGCEVEHWREPLPRGEQIQVFLHYVDKAGIWGDVCRFDTRPSLGFPAGSRKLRADDLKKLEGLKRSQHLKSDTKTS
ncbi:MAG: hypothetical protein AAF357_13265 [Verrucomicrobiota bacterium]